LKISEERKSMSDARDFFSALGLFVGGAFVILLLLFFVPFGNQCPGEILGGEEAIGARIYLNGQYVGTMEKYKYIDYPREREEVKIRACTYLKKGDLLRAEKEGHQVYTAIIDPSYNDSRSPPLWAWIKLTPLDEGKQSPNH
jgi:hypothetical protein